MGEIQPRRLRRSAAGDPVILEDERVNVSDLVNIDSRVGQEIKGLRKASGLSLAALSKMTDLSPGYLSQIERGLSTPSVKALHSISRALGVTISWFFQPAPEGDGEMRDYVVRAAHRRELRYGNGMVDQLLSPNLERQLELLYCTMPPGSEIGDQPYDHVGEEAGVVISGQLDLWINDRHVRLNAGDSFAFQSSEPHRYANNGDTPTVVIWAITPPSY